MNFNVTLRSNEDSGGAGSACPQPSAQRYVGGRSP